MKKIIVMQQFKDDSFTFYPDEVRSVSEDKAGYFCGIGWARDYTENPGLGPIPEGMKKVQPLMDFQDAGIPYFEGEQRFVTKAKAGYFCGLGWACDCSGELPTGTADINPKTLKVQDVYAGHVSPTIVGG